MDIQHPDITKMRLCGTLDDTKEVLTPYRKKNYVFYEIKEKAGMKTYNAIEKSLARRVD